MKKNIDDFITKKTIEQNCASAIKLNTESTRPHFHNDLQIDKNKQQIEIKKINYYFGCTRRCNKYFNEVCNVERLNRL